MIGRYSLSSDSTLTENILEHRLNPTMVGRDINLKFRLTDSHTLSLQWKDKDKWISERWIKVENIIGISEKHGHFSDTHDLFLYGKRKGLCICIDINWDSISDKGKLTSNIFGEGYNASFKPIMSHLYRVSPECIQFVSSGMLLLSGRWSFPLVIYGKLNTITNKANWVVTANTSTYHDIFVTD